MHSGFKLPPPPFTQATLSDHNLTVAPGNRKKLLIDHTSQKDRLLQGSHYSQEESSQIWKRGEKVK